MGIVTVRVEAETGAVTVESCDPPPPPPEAAPSLTETSSPALSIAITVLVALLALTGFGVYLAFGPPSKGLTDPFDDHDD